MDRLFRDRADAARQLAERVAQAELPRPLIVLALPRGGVPIAAVIARRLDAPLDLLLVRKIGSPYQPELAVAAVVDAGRPEVVVDDAMARLEDADERYLQRQTQREWDEILRRRQRYLAGREPLPVQGATVVVVDDGIATGTTVRAALAVLRRRGAARLVLAVPVAPHESLVRLRREVDELICLAEPSPFYAIGLHYDDFHQVGDDEVIEAMRSCAVPRPAQAVVEPARQPARAAESTSP